MGRRHGSDLFGLGPGKRRKSSSRSPLPRPRTHRLSRCLAMNGGGETEGRQWRGGGERNGRRNGWEGALVYRTTMSVWKPTLGGQGASWRSALAAKTVTEADDAGGEGKRKKEGRKGACPLPLWEKEEGAGATRQREEELCLRPLEASAWSGGGRVVMTAMTVGRCGAERRHGRQARAGAADADGGSD
uniref:Uncharacterized protein n=1 Tax=Oryza sativa subsp. japonica TaxID=39947 RepID=Q6YT89_ORYSJ|nr:hypothetical protein [Oryza sativa Japonica Group]